MSQLRENPRMDKIARYFVALLLFPSLGVKASNWDQVAQVPDSGTTYYVDYSRITKTPKGFKLWAIVDDERPDPKLHTLSLSYVLELNCEEGKEQYSSLNGYDGHMAGGEIVFSINEPSQWFDIRPNTVVDDRLKTVCRTAAESIHGSKARH